MTKKNSATFKEGDRVVVCPKTMKCLNKYEQLLGRTGLTAEQIHEGSMHVTHVTDDGQLHIKHPRLDFIVHHKFFAQANATVQVARAEQKPTKD